MPDDAKATFVCILATVKMVVWNRYNFTYKKSYEKHKNGKKVSFADSKICDTMAKETFYFEKSAKALGEVYR